MQARYEPFGGTSSVSGAITQNLRLPGQYYDLEGGWNHNGFRNYFPDLGRYAEPDPLGMQGTARFYNPVSGRLISRDPIGFKAGPNFYSYVGSNPANALDPSGLTITVNGSQVDYQTAINYLSRDPGMGNIIHDLNASSTNYNIDFNNTDDDSYNPTTHTVNWDPHSALRCRNGGTQSPALGLGHEMAHADRPWYWKLLEALDNATGWINWGNYDNMEEWRVITGPETDAADTLGEGVRTDHRGTPYWVPTPTSR